MYPRLTQTAILAGGLGTRLRPVYDSGPKCMAPVAGRPFLEHLIARLTNQGFREIILCVGYCRDLIVEYFGDGAQFDAQISYSIEHAPLGTAGALRNAAGQFNAETLLVLNGDSLIEMNYRELLEAHTQRRARITMSVIQSRGARYGFVEFDSEFAITQFKEKEPFDSDVLRTTRFMNAGVYVISRAVLNEIPEGIAVSIEKEVFPAQIGYGFFVHPVTGYFIDIGVPEDFHRAEEEIKERTRK